jgi:hypothetical protein
MHGVLAAVLLAFSLQGLADTVYKTVDEQGVVSFSDTPPEAVEQPVEILEIATPEPVDPEAYEERLQAMREATDRMAQDRREREKHRAELRELAAREQAQRPVQVQYPIVEQYYPYPVRLRPPYRPPWRPPGHYPPHRPTPQITPGNNSQLMRPLVSGGTGGNSQLMRPLSER